MKHLVLISTFALLMGINALADCLCPCMYTIATPINTPILLGSSFANNDTLGTYFSTYAEDGDQACLYNGGYTAYVFDALNPSWTPGTGDATPLPLGTAFWYHKAPGGINTTISRCINANPTLPLPAPLTLAPNTYYFLASWTPPTTANPSPTTYDYLVRGSSSSPVTPNNRTFLWTYNGGWDAVYRYKTSGGWQKLALPVSGLPTAAAPFIPFTRGAIVYYNNTPGAPTFTVTAAGTCPPMVTLTLTFSACVDPLTAANPNNYHITKGCSTGVGGLVTSVSYPHLNDAVACGGTTPCVQTVQLNVTLQTEPCNTYYVSAPGVTSLAGTAVAVSQPFTWPGCASPPNDAPGIFLTGVAVHPGAGNGGSLYAIGDILTIAGGTGSSATVRVTSVGGGGVITAIVVERAGLYTSAPATPNSPTYAGAGTGALLDLTLSSGVATPLVSGVTACGSLKCADATPANIVDAFPPSTSTAKDVWYSFAPAASGSVTVDTCQPLCSGNPCPQSDTVLAVYGGYPGALSHIAGTWYNDTKVPVCASGINANAAGLTFTSQACTTYYIRVSGHNTGNLPGDFALLLNFTPTAPANDACGAFTTVTANSSTLFDNLSPLLNTDGPNSEQVFNDLWFRFRAPSDPGGANDTTVEVCHANFDTALAVYNAPCPASGNLVVFNDNFAGCLNPSASSVQFHANANQFYYVRVGGHTVNDRGCGFLHVASHIPTSPTLPAGGSCVAANCTSFGGCAVKTYKILGSATGSSWTWTLTAPPPCNLSLSGTVPGVPPGSSALALATAFAASINTPPQIIAVACSHTVNPETALLKIFFPGPCAATSMALTVNGCWVDYASLPVAFGPCNFNPDMFALGDPSSADLDCNGNGQADDVDILEGISLDANGDGIPDECQSCVPVVIAGGPDSTIANLGGPATITVQPIGSGPFSYQWRKEGTPLSGQTGAALMLANVTPDAAGLYDVIISNSCGQATSQSAALVVDSQPWLNVAKAGTDVLLWWSTPDYHLQNNSSLNSSGTWTDVAGASPVTLPIGTQPRYFRLQGTP